MTTPWLIFRFERKTEVENEIPRMASTGDESKVALARALSRICEQWGPGQELHYRSGALSLQPDAREAARLAR